MPAMEVIAIDPSINNLGWSRWTINNGKVSLVASGCYVTKSRSDAGRLFEIAQEVRKRGAGCNVVVVENVFLKRGKSNPHSIMKLALAAGVCLGALPADKVHLVTGHPTKHAANPIARRFGVDPKAKNAEHRVDAVSIGYTFIRKHMKK